jgi:hypothetical protein
VLPSLRPVWLRMTNQGVWMNWAWLFPLLALQAMGQSRTAPEQVQDSVASSRSLTATRSSAIPDYQPVTADGRVRWFLMTTVSPSRLLMVGPISAGWGTLRNVPSEYPTHWDGFGKRYGMRLTGVVDRQPDRGGAGVGLGRGSTLPSLAGARVPAACGLRSEDRVSGAPSG